MFKLKQDNEVYGKILNCDFLRCSPAETSTKNAPSSQIYINIPGEDAVISLLIISADLSYDFIRKGDNNRYGNSNDIRLVNLGPIVLFSNFELTNSSGKHIEVINFAHLVFLMSKLKTSKLV